MPSNLRLVADSVIQAIGRPNFEGGLRTGITVVIIIDNHSVRTNPKASVRPRGGVADSLLYAKGLKTRDESRVEPEPEKPGKSSKSKTRVILARTRVPELQVRVLVAGFSMDAAILFSH